MSTAPDPVDSTILFPRKLWYVIAFTAAYMAVAIPWAISRGNKEFLFYIVVMSLMILAVVALHLRAGLSLATLWLLSIWGLMHMAGGLLPLPESWPIDGPNRVLYSGWIFPDRLKYDQVVHAFGFGLLTWVCWQTLKPRLDGSQTKPTFGLLVLCAAASTGFGALNEVVEFTATRIFANTNVGGYENTGWDLVSNLIGAVAVAIMIRLRWERRQRAARNAKRTTPSQPPSPPEAAQ